MQRTKVESLNHLKAILKDGETHNFALRDFRITISRVIGTPNPWCIDYFDCDEEFLNEKQFLKTGVFKGIAKGFLFEETKNNA